MVNLIPKRLIDEVLDIESGIPVRASTLLERNESDVWEVRLRLKKLEKEGKEWLVCAVCKVPVYVAGNTDRKTFYFKHRHERGECPIKTRGIYSQEQIDAIKYQGARESHAHVRLKELIRQSLVADSRFSDLKVEHIFHSLVETEQWRKPDVRATFNGQVIAFEIQLSTTYIDVIMERWNFYKRNGVLLVWIFGRFNPEYQRFTEKDVLYNNNRNLFVVNDETVKESIEDGCFIMEANYQVPQVAGNQIEVNWESRKVGMDDLHFDKLGNRVFHYDAEAAFAKTKAELQRPEQIGTATDGLADLRADFEEFWISESILDNEDWHSLYKSYWGRFRAAGLVVDDYYGERLPNGLLNAIYSLKHGKIIGFGFNLHVEVVHQVFERYRGYLRQYWWLAKAYQRVEWINSEDASGKLAKKIERAKAAMINNHSDYAYNGRFDQLLIFLFPPLLHHMRGKPLPSS
ncbi:conserved protein of unknown function [Georgfuchsia toluolica]|uniref:Competence protein n=1 Tax=Georgfuchsia toluolica TaxID=424218 RepID=A0A916J3W9_9PROT|nr:DUF6035 family protein [Georgfuchsia toluolica]CAG4883724.1 conserved protein of unknown function [Georgfuchsia toluolica]